MARKLQVTRHAPAPDPGEIPEKRHRKLVKAVLDKPLKTLHIDANGYLLIPTPDEVGQILQMTDMANKPGFVNRLARKVSSRVRVTLTRGAATSDAAADAAGAGE